ncbi:MAG: hypothetical protein IIC64_16535 [SAR324 cluster bacterium]|nr:hypothetical protein [SAR324 cluster bacterium]
MRTEFGDDYTLDIDGEWLNLREEKAGGIIGAASLASTRNIQDHLVEKGFVQNQDSRGKYRVRMAGWDRVTELRRGAIESRQAFMAMKYGDSLLDRILEEVFRPAVEQTGFSLKRLDDDPRAGLIDDRLSLELGLSRFLLADMTHGNQGAYWEAGFAEGLGKPVIYTCEKAVFENNETRPHFDTNHHQNVLWSEGRLDQAAIDLKATIRATLPGEAKMTDD